jgi:UDP-2-acetamido-2,6-beta-L-arabino-hexul-4-ose reductase
LKRDKSVKLYLYTKNDSHDILEAYLNEVDFIYHLAGVNRPKDAREFYEGNSNLTKIIVETLIDKNKNTPILLSSSTQSLQDNDYGKSKLEAETFIKEYSKKTNANIFIYRLPNIFGKWSKPNYNSVIATWCHNITRDKEIQINDKNTKLNLVYIDDVIKSFISKLDIEESDIDCKIDTIYNTTLGEIKDLLNKFKNNRKSLIVPEVASGFQRALYATYLSFLPTDKFAYDLKGHADERGTFYEILKTVNNGQFSLSTTACGIKRGGHYHHTKNEKFLVVKGDALIQERHIMTDELVEYKVSGKNMQVVEMIPGYTHNICNIGDCELLLLLWANENYDQDNPDTYYLEV